MEFPIKDGDFFHSYFKLPEGRTVFQESSRGPPQKKTFGGFAEGFQPTPPDSVDFCLGTCHKKKHRLSEVAKGYGEIIP